jgi:manganese oxidase
MKLSRTSFPALLLTVVVFAIAGCGGDDGGDGGSSSTTTPSGATGSTGATGSGATGGAGSTPTEVKMSEFKFDPSDVVAKRGSSIKVVNDGNVVHNLKVRKGGEDVGGTDTFGPGGDEAVEVDFPVGKYEMYCSVPGHEQSGMKGDFTVK